MRRKDESEEDGGIDKSEMRPAMTSSSSPYKNTMDDNDGEEERTGPHVNEILDNFASDTSLPGIAKVYNASNRIVRLFWILVVVICVVMFIWGISEHLERYFKYPKKVTVELLSDPVPFPAVTVCSMRGFDFDVMNTMSEILRTDQDKLNLTLYDDEPVFIGHYIDFIRRFRRMWQMRASNDTKVYKALKEAMSRTGLYAHIDNDILETGGIQIEQFIASCFMAGDDCNMTRDFKHLFSPYYFNCYTYNDPQSAETDGQEASLPWLIPGFDNGLSMVLLTGSGMIKNDSSEIGFFPGIFDSDMPGSGGDGVRIIIHDPLHEPIPQTEGFDVPPGFSASFGIRPRLNQRIGEPHGNCRSDELRMFGFNIPYRQFVCQQLCVQQYSLDKCHCLDETLPLPSIANLTGVKYCHDTRAFLPENCTSRPDAACFDRLLHQYDEHIACAWKSRNEVRRNRSIIKKCDCRPNCEELIYDVSYSLSAWPADGFEGELAIDDIMDVRNFVGAKFTKRQQKLLRAEYKADHLKFMRDFSKINVFISAPEVLVTRETEGYEPSQLVSDIGGQQGIWLGLSLITAAEVVHLLGEIFHRVFINNRRHRR